MTDFRYWAFLSYSHADQNWAAWLHRALESYRIPRRLVATDGPAGVIPKRLAPIFRDREELAAAHDLSENILEALRESRSLIVVCSPHAARSNWVNEEIRRFQALGRGDRIFCVVVDGDPSASAEQSPVFPPALFEGPSGADREPLAADPRSWSDGKRVALLKIVAAVLGVRLDELRRRDHRRRQFRGALAIAGIVAAITLATVTLLARIGEQKEREQTEQMASFMVDLGERVQSTLDLETLSMITDQANRVFSELRFDRLTPEMGKRVALAMRQFGRVEESQGRLAEALDSYTRSRDLLSDLHARFADDESILFELSQSEYYIGNLHFNAQEFEQTLPSMEAYERHTRRLLELDRNDPTYRLELSYSLTNQAAARLRGNIGPYSEALQLIDEGVETIEYAMSLMPEDNIVLGHYSTTLAWFADAQAEVCDLENALPIREKTLQAARDAFTASPNNKELKSRLAYARSGLASIHVALGRLDSALANYGESIELLESLVAIDPSNAVFQHELSLRRLLEASLLGWMGETGRARALFGQLEREFERGEGLGMADDITYTASRSRFYLELAAFEVHGGRMTEAMDSTRKAVGLVLDGRQVSGLSQEDRRRITRLRYLWSRAGGTPGGLLPVSVETVAFRDDDDHQSCRDHEALAMQAVLTGDRETARDHAATLNGQGYRSPQYVDFCTAHDLCLQ